MFCSNIFIFISAVTRFWSSFSYLSSCSFHASIWWLSQQIFDLFLIVS
jgi:hypothetical protein